MSKFSHCGTKCADSPAGFVCDKMGAFASEDYELVCFCYKNEKKVLHVELDEKGGVLAVYSNDICKKGKPNK